MTAKHMTDWHIDRSEGTKIKDGGGNTVLWTQHTHLRGRRTDDEVMQIAHLAAAAPELLAALQALDAYWTADFPEGPDGSRKWLGGLGEVSEDTMAVWRTVRAAISKAGGTNA